MHYLEPCKSLVPSPLQCFVIMGRLVRKQSDWWFSGTEQHRQLEGGKESSSDSIHQAAQHHMKMRRRKRQMRDSADNRSHHLWGFLHFFTSDFSQVKVLLCPLASSVPGEEDKRGTSSMHQLRGASELHLPCRSLSYSRCSPGQPGHSNQAGRHSPEGGQQGRG